jgi:hypothetical protein
MIIPDKILPRKTERKIQFGHQKRDKAWGRTIENYGLKFEIA